MSLSILSLIFLMSFASALILTGSDTIFSQLTGDTLSIGIIGIGAGNTVTFSFTQVKDYTGKEITFTVSPSSLSSDGTIVITSNVPLGFDFFGEKHTTTLTATEKNSIDTVISSATQTLTFAETSFCKWNGNNFNESINELTVEIKDVTVTEGFGDDKDWALFDAVEVEVEVENNGDYDTDNIVLEWGLYDKKSGNWVIDVAEEDEFNLKDGDKETKIIAFKLDDDLDVDFEDLDGSDLVFYARATGDFDNDAGDTICGNDFADDVSLTIEGDFVMVENINMVETASCESEVQLSADVWNVGDSDQDAVVVNIYNKELGINKDVEIGDISAFDNEQLDFTFTLPKALEEKVYALKLTVYDEDGKVYQNENEDDSVATVSLKVEGNCAVAEASVSAVLESGGKAGRELVVKATVTNTGDKTTTYLLNVAGYSEWASLASLDKTSVTLNAGESQDVLVTLDVNKGVLGEKLFNLEVLSENQLIVNQPISVEITKGTGLFGITGNVLSGNNKYLWAIGIANVVLIVLIIVIAVKIARK